jgi:hypothetical protein
MNKINIERGRESFFFKYTRTHTYTYTCMVPAGGRQPTPPQHLRRKVCRAARDCQTDDSTKAEKGVKYSMRDSGIEEPV